MNTRIRFRLRIYRNETIAIGPGKVTLLEAIGATGSISGAARRLNMSYRRAWLLVEEMNRALASPAVATATGGSRGGGAILTPVGETIIRRYRAIESRAEAAATEDIAALTDLLAQDTEDDQKRSPNG